jgi:hypothetical protein
MVLLRYALSSGAPNATPIGFIEAGAHIAVWAGLALALAARSRRGATIVRRASAGALGAVSLGASAVAGLLWLTPFWSSRAFSGVDWPVFQHAPLGFALPAMLAWGHWAFWRNRGAHMRTRAALASAGLLTAAFIVLEVIGARSGVVDPGQTDWVSVTALVIAFGLAIGVNFAPGVTAEPGQGLQFEEYFQRNRRREQRS